MPDKYTKRPPRKTPSRDEKYMALAFIIAGFSKDPDTQVGAYIIDDEGKPVGGGGYNGPPANIDDKEMDWTRDLKYGKIKHAELNAIKHAHASDLSDCTLYVTAKPCKKCMLELVDWNLKEIVYFPFKSKDKSSSLNFNSKDLEEADQIAKDGNLTLREFKGNLNWIRDWVGKLKEMDIFDNHCN